MVFPQCNSLPEKLNILSRVIYPKSDLGIYPEGTAMVHTEDKLIDLSENSYPYINEGYLGSGYSTFLVVTEAMEDITQYHAKG